jgi:7-carboxy-7-deazaguanine synthase
MNPVSVEQASPDQVERGGATATVRLKLTEIFLSLQGESSLVGWPTVFVRLTGCPLRCQYCDTAYAFHGGEWHSLQQVLEQVRAQGVRHVCVTGGEPLAQKACVPLLSALCDEGYVVSLETSGAIDVSAVDPRVIRVVDIKTPGSGEVGRNRWDNMALLNERDQIKFVLCGRDDYDWARTILDKYALPARCTVLLSPSHGQLQPRDLADWIVADRLPVRMQLQLHKILWGNEPGR